MCLCTDADSQFFISVEMYDLHCTLWWGIYYFRWFCVLFLFYFFACKMIKSYLEKKNGQPAIPAATRVSRRKSENIIILVETDTDIFLLPSQAVPPALGRNPGPQRRWHRYFPGMLIHSCPDGHWWVPILHSSRSVVNGWKEGDDCESSFCYESIITTLKTESQEYTK